MRTAQEGEEDEVLQVLLYALRNDSSASVRKGCLANIEITKDTIPYVVERIRDVDPMIRRYVYKNSMKEIGNFLVFSIQDRETILSWGLKDRYFYSPFM